MEFSSSGGRGGDGGKAGTGIGAVAGGGGGGGGAGGSGPNSRGGQGGAGGVAAQVQVRYRERLAGGLLNLQQAIGQPSNTRREATLQFAAELLTSQRSYIQDLEAKVIDKQQCQKQWKDRLLRHQFFTHTLHSQLSNVDHPMFLQACFYASSIPCFVASPFSFLLLDVNEPFAHSMHIMREDMIGMKLADFFQKDTPALLEQLSRVVCVNNEVVEISHLKVFDLLTDHFGYVIWRSELSSYLILSGIESTGVADEWDPHPAATVRLSIQSPGM